MILNGVDFETYFKNYPDEDGYFGKYGGRFVDDDLRAAMEEITDAYFMSEGSRMLRMILLECRRRNEDEPEKDVKEIIEETVRETYIALEKSLHE